MSLDEAHRACISEQTQRQFPVIQDLDLAELPTLCELEHYCRKQQPGKAPGLDRIPAAVPHFLAAELSPHLHQLLCKSVIHGCEPFAFKGGKLIALYKGSGSRYNPAKYRGILLSSCLAKVSQGWLRARVLPFFRAGRSAGQLKLGDFLFNRPGWRSTPYVFMPVQGSALILQRQCCSLTLRRLITTS